MGPFDPARFPANQALLSDLTRTVAAMNERLGHVCERLLDAADLAIDFLTLGEYGLEPAPTPAGGPTASGRGPCEGPRRSGVGLPPIDPGEHLPADFKRAIQRFEV